MLPAVRGAPVGKELLEDVGPPRRDAAAGRTGDRTEPALLDVATLYEQQAEFVWRSLQHLGVREADLEDVFQEVFVVVHRKLSTFDGSSRVTTWLFGICLRVAAGHRRRAYFRWERQVAVVPERMDPRTPEDGVAQRQARMRLDELLDGLSVEQRAVFVLFEIEGKSTQEIAELVGAPIGTVHSRLHVARRRIQKALTRLQRRGRDGGRDG